MFFPLLLGTWRPAISFQPTRPGARLLKSAPCPSSPSSCTNHSIHRMDARGVSMPLPMCAAVAAAPLRNPPLLLFIHLVVGEHLRSVCPCLEGEIARLLQVVVAFLFIIYVVWY